MTVSVYYTSASTRLGNVGIVWRPKGNGAIILRIFLPREDERMDVLIRRFSPSVVRRSHRMITQVCRSIRALAAGRDATLSEKILDMKTCGEFQRRILSQVMRIPRERSVLMGGLRREAGLQEVRERLGMPLR